jgi:hypothetical protein
MVRDRLDPTACKVMQLWLQCRLPRTHTPNRTTLTKEESRHPERP